MFPQKLRGLNNLFKLLAQLPLLFFLTRYFNKYYNQENIGDLDSATSYMITSPFWIINADGAYRLLDPPAISVPWLLKCCWSWLHTLSWHEMCSLLQQSVNHPEQRVSPDAALHCIFLYCFTVVKHTVKQASQRWQGIQMKDLFRLKNQYCNELIFRIFSLIKEKIFCSALFFSRNVMLKAFLSYIWISG